jgi:hypothetical protein
MSRQRRQESAMSEQDEEPGGHRESPMMYDGGVRTEPRQEPPAAAALAELRDGHPIYDGLPGPPPGGAGRSWARQKRSHPPVDCPDPKLMGSLRGYYRCPGCGVKVRLSGHVTVRESAYETADWWAAGVVEAARMAWEMVTDMARGVAWLYVKLTRKRGSSEPENSGGVATDLVRALVLLGVAMARNEPETGQESAADTTVSQAK